MNGVEKCMAIRGSKSKNLFLFLVSFVRHGQFAPLWFLIYLINCFDTSSVFVMSFYFILKSLDELVVERVVNFPLIDFNSFIPKKIKSVLKMEKYDTF